MPNETAPQLCYPYNLLVAVKGLTALELPAKLSADVQFGLHYALSTLPEAEREVVHLHYSEGISFPEIAERLSMPLEQISKLGAGAIKKLRLPSRWNYIQYGIAGCLKNETAKQYAKGFQTGYMAGHRDGTAAAQSGTPISSLEDDRMNQPIEFLNLSPRAYNCLDRGGYRHIREVAAMDEITILGLRSLGPKGADEIARALCAYGIAHTAWNQFLL